MWLLLWLLVGAPGDPVLPQPPCTRTETSADGSVSARRLPYRECVRLSEPRVVEGVWLSEFEGSQFVEGATDLKSALTAGSEVWLAVDAETENLPPWTRDRAYRVRMVARFALERREGVLSGYGHMGVFPELVVVDRFESVQDLGPIGRP